VLWVELYDFTGFYAPVTSGWNTAKAGRAIPVKFSLNAEPATRSLTVLAPDASAGNLTLRVSCPCASVF
jgi:hypothetical protein